MATTNGSAPPRQNSIPGIMREPPRVPQAVRGTPIDIPHILPHEKVFPIQIGSELFRLSGASISSDGSYPYPLKTSKIRTLAKNPRAPSYFSAFFVCQLASQEAQKAEGEENTTVRTLYIDRDPLTFKDISRHLQGYHVQPRDAGHFVKLFADAQFYQCKLGMSSLDLRISVLTIAKSTPSGRPALRRIHLRYCWRPRFPLSKRHIFLPWRLTQLLHIRFLLPLPKPVRSIPRT